MNKQPIEFMQDLANARLIAAAPQLLEALKAVTATEMFLPDHPQRQAAYKAARAYGVHVTFGTFDEMLRVNLANQSSWRAIIPTAPSGSPTALA